VKVNGADVIDQTEIKYVMRRSTRLLLTIMRESKTLVRCDQIIIK
jgi:hypothetical protein